MGEITDIGVLTIMLKNFAQGFLAGYSRIHAASLTILHLIGLIDIVLAALFTLWRRDDGMFSWLAQATLTYGFWIGLVSIWITLTPTILNGFVWFGLTAGNSTMTVHEFTNPSQVARLGFVATEPIWNHIRNYGWSAAFHTMDIIISGLCGIVILLCFVLIAVEIAIYFIEFYLFAVLASVLLPFGVNRHTSWIADGTLATLLGHGMKLMTLAFLVSVIFPLVQRFTVPDNPTWVQLFSMLGGALVIAGLCLLVPRRAAAMFAHGPQLTAGVFAGALLASTVLTGNVGSAAGRGIRSAVSAGGRLAPQRQGGPTPIPAGSVRRATA